MEKKVKVKNIIHCVCSIIIFIMLGFMAYIAFSGLFSLPMPEFIDNFVVFYGIFNAFDLYSLTINLPLIVGIAISLSYFAEKNAKLAVFIIEVVFILAILLHGFGAF